MNDVLAALLVTPALALIASALLLPRRASSGVARFRQLVTWIAGAQFIVATSLAVAYATGVTSMVDVTLLSLGTDSSVGISVLFDGVASLMLVLVSFVGWVICRYSIRFLDGEPTQGQYFAWTGFTIGAVSLMVISGDLLMFVICWVMTSLGLHQLLLHYGHRPAARRAAWTKFTISRIGDAALLAAIVVLYSEFKTLHFAELFASIGSSAGAASPATSVAGLLLIVGAITKSAQFPFHTWLPQTMETPTPVSALMHAGIVNAGGYLIIRTSPIVSLTPWALSLLAVIGAVTACFAAVVMLTQTSVKKSLAYSTIAQMGFMMLQCGLGAFSAAMLHIVAHSLYKAYAFLSSGNVIAEHAATQGVKPVGHDVTWTKLAFAGAIIVSFLGIAFVLCGIDAAEKPGGILLGGVFCLALTYWVGQVMRGGNHRLLIQAFAVAGLLCLTYSISFVAVDKIVASSLSAASVPALVWPVVAIVLVGFAGLFALHAQLSQIAGASKGAGPQRIHVWYVHASNGFYLENGLRRVFGPLRSI